MGPVQAHSSAEQPTFQTCTVWNREKTRPQKVAAGSRQGSAEQRRQCNFGADAEVEVVDCLAADEDEVVDDHCLLTAGL